MKAHKSELWPCQFDQCFLFPFERGKRSRIAQLARTSCSADAGPCLHWQVVHSLGQDLDKQEVYCSLGTTPVPLTTSHHWAYSFEEMDQNKVNLFSMERWSKPQAKSTTPNRVCDIRHGILFFYLQLLHLEKIE